MPLLGRVRGSSAEGPGGRPPSFPRKRVDGAQASWYVWNGRYGKIELDPILTDQRQRRTYGNGERYFYVSYGVLTEFLRTFATDNGDTGTEERIRDGENHA